MAMTICTMKLACATKEMMDMSCCGMVCGDSVSEEEGQPALAVAALCSASSTG